MPAAARKPPLEVVSETVAATLAGSEGPSPELPDAEDQSAGDSEAPAAPEPVDLPANVPELAKASGRKLWETNDPTTGQPVLPQEFATIRDAYNYGVDIGVDMIVRLIPGPSPTDGVHFAIEQLWVHQRHLLANIISLRQTVERLAGKLDEYEKVLPAPDSLMARIGHWGRK